METLPGRATRLSTAAVLGIVLASLALTGASLSHASLSASGGSSLSIYPTVVTWDGKNIGSASSPSTAFALTKGSTAAVIFTFPPTSGYANATLRLNYLGIVLTTARAAACDLCGSAEINWTFGTLTDALEGVFQLTAGLAYANGTTAWSESFYVFMKAPYLFESGAPAILIILLVAESYWIASAIREARRESKGPAASTTGTAPSSSAPGTSGPAANAPSSGPTPAGTPPGSAGPPSGGSSP